MIAVFLMKLIREIGCSNTEEDINTDSPFADFFNSENKKLLEDLHIGLVIPQQSLRASVRKVFKLTSRLDQKMVLDVFELGSSSRKFDLLIVDEAHRLNQRSNQSSAYLNRKFSEINHSLFGSDDDAFNQLDWIEIQSSHRVFLLDQAQSVRPGDLSKYVQEKLVTSAKMSGNYHELRSQMRVKSKNDYVSYVRAVLSREPPLPQVFDDYDLRLYDDFSLMRSDIMQRNNEFGLARMIAGFAWPWKSKSDKKGFDIEIDNVNLRWNSTAKDWINSPGSINEVGSIHTVQGYDLNYAGVIIGRDLGYDSQQCRLKFNRDQYFDAKGKENNNRLGISYDDDDLLAFILNIYAVLLTRGIRGTYIYVCSLELRDYFRQYIVRTP